MNEVTNIKEDDIVYLQHRILSREGIAIDFKIKGSLFTRVSMLRSINNFHKNDLLWWKRDNNEYCNEKQSKELEGIIKAFVMPESFRQQFQVENKNLQ